jgi:dTMP kinase
VVSLFLSCWIGLELGAFITFEGIEGCGKTTQIKKAADFLRRNNIDVFLTEEPGGSALGVELRRILLNRNESSAGISARSEILLFLADRAQHVDEIIRPALERGQTVLCDRYSDATIAYQGYGRGLDLDTVISLDRFSSLSLKPEVTFLFDLPAEAGLKRAFHRIAGNNATDAEDRFENEDIRFHSRVRNGYLSLARNEPQRFRVIDSTGSIEAVAGQVRTELITIFNLNASKEY